MKNASVEAGGGHEGLIGTGFALGPLAGLIGVAIQPHIGSEVGGTLRGAAPILPPGAVIFGFPAGGMVPPGTYTARLTAGENVQEAAFTIAADPRGTATQEEMNRQYEFLNQVAGKIGEVGQKIIALRSVRSQVQAVSAQVAESGADEATRTSVADAAEAIVTRLTELENELVQTKSRSFEDPLNYPGKLTALLANVHASANSGADAPPTDGAVELFAQLSLQADGIFGHIDTVISDDVKAFNDLVAGIDRPAVVISR